MNPWLMPDGSIRILIVFGPTLGVIGHEYEFVRPGDPRYDDLRARARVLPPVRKPGSPL